MNLTQFLVKAKKSTYASQGEGNERTLEDGTKELTYEEDGFKYQDRYKGFEFFKGQEKVWKNDKLIWTMYYQGGITSKIVPEKEVYEFLKKALRKITEDKPFRGPDNFKDGDFEYINKVEGDINKFKGIELIFYKGKEVHTVKYYGRKVD